MGLFDRIWGAWGNIYRRRPEDRAQQEGADTAENQNIARAWPTEEQQRAADDAEAENIRAYPVEDEPGEGSDGGDFEGGEEGEGEEGAE